MSLVRSIAKLSLADGILLTSQALAQTSPATEADHRRMLDARDLGATTFPAPETRPASGDLAFRRHAGGLTAGPNWPDFLDFAARYLEPATR